MKLKRIAVVAAGCLALVIGYLLARPVPIEPVAWNPPAYDPADPVPTGSLANAVRVEIPDGFGPEDVELDGRGRVVVGLADGRLLRWPAGGLGTPEVVADTGGRPLGLHPAPDGGLYVADAFAGLLHLTADDALRTLTTTCGGERLVFTNDLDTTRDGKIYFTDASTRFDQGEWKLDLLENRPSGRLCVHDPATGTTEILVDGLHFANGVAIDPSETFLLVNETARYRVQKVWLEGARRGQHEVVIGNLPGFPDGISAGSGGRFWIAVASPRNSLVDRAGPSPWLRKVMVRLPEILQPKPRPTARAIAITGDGRVVQDLFDPEGVRIRVVTSVQERNGTLYLGSLVDSAWAHLPVPAASAGP